MGSANGIITADGDRLILRPVPVLFRRRELLRLFVVGALALVGAAMGLAYLFRPHTTYSGAIVLALFMAAAMFLQLTRQVTFIALRGAEGIDIETRNHLLRTRRRRVLHRYRDIEEVRLRPRVKAPGAATLYDVLVVKRGRARLFWYTRHRESADEIARTIAVFAGVAVSGGTSSRS